MLPASLVFLLVTWASAGLCPELLTIVAAEPPLFTFEMPTPSERDFAKAIDDIQIGRSLREAAKRYGYEEKEVEPAIQTARYFANDLMRNAVMWGNEFDPDKRVRFNVYVTPTRILVSVADQGLRPFEPFNAEGSIKAGESEADFARRRKALGRPLGGNTSGVFLAGMRARDVDYTYTYDGGSRVTIGVPWK